MKLFTLFSLIALVAANLWSTVTITHRPTTYTELPVTRTFTPWVETLSLSTLTTTYSQGGSIETDTYGFYTVTDTAFYTYTDVLGPTGLSTIIDETVLRVLSSYAPDVTGGISPARQELLAEDLVKLDLSNDGVNSAVEDLEKARLISQDLGITYSPAAWLASASSAASRAEAASASSTNAANAIQTVDFAVKGTGALAAIGVAILGWL